MEIIIAGLSENRLKDFSLRRVQESNLLVQKDIGFQDQRIAVLPTLHKP